jgi:hypothetical protein
MHLITLDWLYAHRTPRGGWTLDQMRAVGGPRPGWRERAVGTIVADDVRERFERRAGVHGPWKPKVDDLFGTSP